MQNVNFAELKTKLLTECETTTFIFAGLGALWALTWIWPIFKALLWYTCKKRNVNLYAKYGKKTGVQQEKSWALVTGASDGIGL